MLAVVILSPNLVSVLYREMFQTLFLVALANPL